MLLFLLFLINQYYYITDIYVLEAKKDLRGRSYRLFRKRKAAQDYSKWFIQSFTIKKI